MNRTAKYYFEAHVTIEPVFDDRLIEAKKIAETNGFKIAHLLMKKREVDTEERSSRDTFMTTHSKKLDDIVSRTSTVVQELRAAGFKVWRYKIEDIVLDSKCGDDLNLLESE